MTFARSKEMTWMAALLASAAMGAGMLFAYERMQRNRRAGFPPVRDAGRKSMENPPREWDLLDETDDASFPASDPPGNY